jgi:hypothetical protein
MPNMMPRPTGWSRTSVPIAAEASDPYAPSSASVRANVHNSVARVARASSPIQIMIARHVVVAVVNPTTRSLGSVSTVVARSRIGGLPVRPR